MLVINGKITHKHINRALIYNQKVKKQLPSKQKYVNHLSISIPTHINFYISDNEISCATLRIKHMATDQTCDRAVSRNNYLKSRLTLRAHVKTASTPIKSALMFCRFNDIKQVMIKNDDMATGAASTAPLF